jgi:signal transduction histidine kinase
MLIFVGIFDIFFILLLKNTSFTTLGVSSFVFLEGAVFYSITRHRLLDIRLVVARTVAYSLLTTALFAFYVFSTLIVTTLFLKTPTRIEQLLLFGVLALMVAYSFQPLRKAFEHFTDRIFYKDRYDSDELLSKLTKIMATTLGLSNLTEKLLIKLVPEMKISKAAFVLMNKGKVTHIENAGFDKNVKFISTDILSLVEKGKLIFIEEARDKHIKKIMYNLGITVSVPLLVGKKELGVLLLGHKLSGEVYTDQDIKFLEILAPETSVAIENAKAYEEIRKFSITLQKEVEKATSDLRHANERLKELDKLKDEFMSIASHELRTPMTAIKSYVWLVLNNKSGEVGSKIRNYLTKVYDSSERMIAMINDMLNVSRIETGRLQLEIVPASIPKVLDQVVGELSAKAAETGVEIKTTKEAVIPLVLVDRDKLAEIFTNLIGNALKFTSKGGAVTVTSQKSGGMVETSVTDTGIGISKENIEKLFKKYGKLNESYATVSPSTGTGLGLYITKQYLEKMHGTVSVKSTLGKGTTFTFSLPIAKGVTKETEEKKEVAAFVPKSIIK